VIASVSCSRMEKLGVRTLEQQLRSDDVTEEVIDL
jgi:hypothetical protein